MRLINIPTIALFLWSIFSFYGSAVAVTAQEEQQYDYILTVKRQVVHSNSGGQDLVTKLDNGRGVVEVGGTLNAQKCGGCTVTLEEVENGIATVYFTNPAGSCQDVNHVVVMEGRFDVVVGTSLTDAPQQQWLYCTDFNGYVWFGLEQRNMITRSDKDDLFDIEMEEEQQQSSAGRRSTLFPISAALTVVSGFLMLCWNLLETIEKV